MASRIEELLKRNYPEAVAVEKDADGKEHFAAWLLDLPGCIAQGDTKDDAVARLRSIKRAYFEQLLEVGAPIPEPTKLPALMPGSVGFYDSRTGLVHLEVPPSRQVKLGESSGLKSRLAQVA